MLWATKMSHYVLVLHCLHKECPCTPFFYKLGKTQVPTTKRAESMSPDCLYYKDCSQYCFIVQSLHTTRPTFSWDYKNHSKVIPKILYILKIVSSRRFFTLYQNGFKKACSATSLHCQTCTKHAPTAFLYYGSGQGDILILLRNIHVGISAAKLAQSSFHITLYHKSCTKHIPTLICITTLAQSTPSISVHSKDCRMHLPILLCLTRLAPNKASTQHAPVLPCTFQLP